MRQYLRSGVLMPVLCAIHCAAMPLLVSAAPAFGGLLADQHGLEFALIALSVALGGKPLWRDFQQNHGQWTPGLLFFAGIAVILSGHAEWAPMSELSASLLGAALLVLAQVANVKEKNRHECATASCCVKDN